MKSKGIWLLDATIVGLYGNNAKYYPEACQEIIKTCWDNYIRRTRKEANPKFIIVIGKQVGSILFSRLTKLGIPFETLYQPQVRISAEERLRNFQRFNEICTSILRGEVPPRFSGMTKNQSFQNLKKNQLATRKKISEILDIAKLVEVNGRSRTALFML